LQGPADSVDTSAVLNGGFEVAEPHVLLPAPCAARVLGDYRPRATQVQMEAAGGDVSLLEAGDRVRARVRAGDRLGPEVSFRVLVSETDAEVLVSDAGIDALGIRIESFAPGRWRLSDEVHTRDTEAPQLWLS
jgi:hypothetical protein